MTTTIQLGDKVSWSSQAGSYNSKKTGEVVLVVPASTPTARRKFHVVVPWKELCAKWDAVKAGEGNARNHEFYVVHVPGAPKKRGKGRRKGKLYCPRVPHLRKLKRPK